MRDSHRFLIRGKVTYLAIIPRRVVSGGFDHSRSFPNMNRFLLTTLCVGLLAAVGVGAELKSGPEVGKSVRVFNPLNVTGSAAGEKACPV
jgi:hypothetical protein